MKNKISIIYGIIIIIIVINISVPANNKSIDNDDLIGKTRIRAIGTFHICEEEDIIYGRIFIGFYGLKPVILKNIEIEMNDIVWIVMTNHILRCVTR